MLTLAAATRVARLRTVAAASIAAAAFSSTSAVASTATAAVGHAPSELVQRRAAIAAGLIAAHRRDAAASARGFQKKDKHIVLYESVPGIGERGEIVLVPGSCARNFIIPMRLGYYVPHHRGQPILPRGWQPRVEASDAEVETILPAMFDLNERIAVSASRPKATAAAPDASRPEAVAALAVRLGQLPALTFERALIGGGAEGAAPSTRTFGSVTADDVVVALQSEHGVELPGGRSSVRVDGGRIKDVGTHAVHINVGDGGEVVLTVVVRAPKGDE